MNKRPVFLVSVALLMCMCNAILADDVNPPAFAGGEQTGVVFWEFLDDSDQPSSVIHDPPYIYKPDLANPIFGRRYGTAGWEWQADAGMNGNGAMLFAEEESLGDRPNIRKWRIGSW